LLAIPTVLVVLTFVFLVMRLLPGNVAYSILGGAGTQEDVKRIEARLGLDRPLTVQYVDWLERIATLDLGTSLVNDEPILGQIGRRVGLTINLAVLSMVIGLVIAVPAGLIAALRQDTKIDYLMRVLSIVGIAVPNFYLGLLLLLAAGLWLDFVPSYVYRSPFDDPIANLKQLFLPALALGAAQAALVARMTRSVCLDVLRSDFVRTARAKGLATTAVTLRHVLRPSLLPVVTVAGSQMARALGGAIVVETVFNLPGLGSLMFEAISKKDYPTVQAAIGLASIFVVLVNLLVDILYGLLDPRVRLG
jgi:peptide/nickel transport system permease protein